MSDTKIINYGYTAYGQVFWDESGKIITTIHENDGEYRREYFNDLFEHFGIEVIFHQRIPKEIKKEATKWGV